MRSIHPIHAQRSAAPPHEPHPPTRPPFTQKHSSTLRSHSPNARQNLAQPLPERAQTCPALNLRARLLAKPDNGITVDDLPALQDQQGLPGIQPDLLNPRVTHHREHPQRGTTAKALHGNLVMTPGQSPL